jgi:hypothetical protein
MILKRTIILIAAVAFLLAGCSQDRSGSTNSKSDAGSANKSVSDSSAFNEKSEKAKDEKDTDDAATERMVIHTADIRMKVKNLSKTQQKIEEKVTKYGGYVVQSNSNDEGEGALSGSLTVRIPEKRFQQFLHDAEESAAKVQERSIKGEDITEEYVDLQSRLKSKQAVETRLLEFMKNAAKTEDLLKISADLATVQEDMERIQGRMKFLDNQVSYSTVNISMFENRVVVPDVDKDNLNTWEKTKRQFAGSMNFLLSAGSGIIVFFIGNIPVLLLLALIGWIIYRYMIKRNRMQ